MVRVLDLGWMCTSLLDDPPEQSVRLMEAASLHTMVLVSSGALYAAEQTDVIRRGRQLEHMLGCWDRSRLMASRSCLLMRMGSR